MTERPDFALLRRQASLLNVAGRLGVQVMKGNKVRCCNPGGHSNGDHNPSVTLFVEDGSFHCWVCPDVRGDVIDFARMFGGLDWRGAVDVVRECAGMPVQESQFAAVPKKYGRAPREAQFQAMEALLEVSQPIDSRCRAYLESRGIDPEVADAAGVRCLVTPGQAKTLVLERLGMNHEGLGVLFNDEGNLRFHMHRLLFPYWNEDGRCAFIQGRDITGKGAAKELGARQVGITVPWVVPGVFESRRIALTEGVIDGLTMLTHGRAAVGLPGAGTWQKGWARYFLGYEVLTALDGDKAGREATEAIHADLAAEGVPFADLGIPDKQDVNSLAKEGSLDQLLELAERRFPSYAG